MTGAELVNAAMEGALGDKLDVGLVHPAEGPVNLYETRFASDKLRTLARAEGLVCPWPGCNVPADRCQLLIDGMYPVLTRIPLLLAGINIGRLILNSAFTARISATSGALLALIGYGTNWALVHFTDFMAQRIAVYRQFDPSLAHAPDEELMDQFGTVAYANFGVTDTNEARSLLLAAHHSGSITELIGGIGFTLLVLTGVALFEQLRCPRTCTV